MRRLFTLIALAALTFLPTTQGLAFGTVNGLGQSAEHEKITRRAFGGELGPLTLDQLAGRRGTFGAVGAPDRPTQEMFELSEAHCDNADYLAVPGYPRSQPQAQAMLERCRALMAVNMDNAVNWAGQLIRPNGQNTRLNCRFSGNIEAHAGSPKCEVLRRLGLVLHAAQDFYSHSNWADAADPSRPIDAANPPGLGNLGRRAPWLDLGQQAAFPQGLITGCYEGAIETAHCLYTDPTGMRRIRVRHAALNKDKGALDPQTLRPGVGTTGRGKSLGNFASAVDAATDDSASKWAFFQARVRARYGAAAPVILCALSRDNYRACAAR